MKNAVFVLSVPNPGALHRFDTETHVFHHGMATCPALEPMTVIFRLAFGAVFQSVSFFAPRTGAGPIVVKAMAALQNSSAKLDGTEGQDLLIAALVAPGAGVSDDEFQALMASDYANAEGKQKLLAATGFDDLNALLVAPQNRRVGHNVYLMEEVEPALEQTMAILFGFYVYGWLVLLRAERTLISISLSVRRKRLAAQGHLIGELRVRMINVQRYFLTDDRSNVPRIKEFCTAMRTKLKLVERHNRIAETNRDMEYHLDNSSKLLQNAQLGSVANLILLLTFLSIPISFFSAVLAVNLNTDIFRNTLAVINDIRVYLIFLIGVVIVLLPFSILKILDMARAGWRHVKRAFAKRL